jgi:hypothetical protein
MDKNEKGVKGSQLARVWSSAARCGSGVDDGDCSGALRRRGSSGRGAECHGEVDGKRGGEVSSCRDAEGRLDMLRTPVRFG